jgi:hypothetical protein
VEQGLKLNRILANKQWVPDTLVTNLFQEIVKNKVIILARLYACKPTSAYYHPLSILTANLIFLKKSKSNFRVTYPLPPCHHSEKLLKLIRRPWTDTTSMMNSIHFWLPLKTAKNTTIIIKCIVSLLTICYRFNRKYLVLRVTQWPK